MGTWTIGMFRRWKKYSTWNKMTTLSCVSTLTSQVNSSQLQEKTAISASMMNVFFLKFKETKSLAVTCKAAGWNNVGHENRVFCVKFVNQNLLISGGWDSVVHIWDVREGKSIRHFLGPHISGDSLDYQDGKILAGCYAA